MNRSTFLSLAAAGMLTGCSSIMVDRDYDPSFRFGALKTFAWKHAVQPKTGLARIDNDLNDQRIRRAVDAELQAKGFVPAEQSAADFLVEYFADYQQRIESSGSTVSLGVGRGSAGRTGAVGWSSGAVVSDYEEAQLTIDILNPETGRIVWRGRGRRRAASSASPEKTDARTRESVKKILKAFPPKG